VAEHGMQDSVSFREGDVLSEPLGEELDVVSMFNLLHHLTPAQVQSLLARARAALADGGCLVIGETERTAQGEDASMIGAVSALVYYASSGTRNYTRQELTRWLEQAGFARVEVRRAEQTPWRLLYLARA
jgi:SAM-dependent methyltransferase